MAKECSRRINVLLVILLVIAELMKLYLLQSYHQSYGMGMIEVTINEEDRLTYNFLSNQEGYDTLRPAVEDRQYIKLEALNNQRILVVETNGYYDEVQSLKVKWGRYFTETAVREGRNLVVISTQLAEQLYRTRDGVGNLLYMNHTYYQVVGIYEKNATLWEKLFDDGIERIYIPIQSQLDEEGKVERLVVRQREEAPYIREEEVLRMLQLKASKNLVNDKGEAYNNLLACNRISSGIVVSILLWKLLALVSKKYAYVCYCLGLYMIWHFILGQITLPSEALPSYQLFDLAFYLGRFKEECIRYNYLLQNNMSIHFRTYTYMLGLLSGLGILQVVFSMMIPKYMKS